MKKNDMNLLESYYALEKMRKSQSKDGVVYLAIILAALLLTGAYSLKLYIDNYLVTDRIDQLNAFLQSESVQEKVKLANLIDQNTVILDQVETQLTSINSVLDFIPVFDQRILDVIYTTSPNSVHYSNISYDQNTITIEYYEHFSPTASTFALHLLESGIFEDVSYTGYSYDTDAGVYRGKVVCIVKGGV